MKTLTLIAALALLSGCAGTWVECKSVKYIVGAKHEALAQCVSAQSKGYDAKMVLGKRGDELTAWCEVDGKAVDRVGSPRRLLPNPHWPFAMPVAVKRGTPAELGLITPQGAPAKPRWLLHTSENARLIGHYEACKAMYDSATVATDGSSYWLEVTVDGKRYAETTRQGHLDHYGKAPEGYVVQWRGTIAEYMALADARPPDPAKQEASREAARRQLSIIPGAYWVKK